MFDTPAKRVREDVARAKSALSKGKTVKSVEHFVSAVKEYKTGKIFGREKFEAEVHIQEYLKEFNRHPDIKEYYSARNVHVTPYIAFSRGEEAELLAKAEDILGHMVGASKEAEQEKQAKQEHRKEELIAKGQSYLDAGEFPRGKSILRRVAEEYGKEEGIKTDIGQRLLKAELYFEAGEILESALADAPRDSHALVAAIKAYKSAREFPKMEMLYKHAIRTFGAHPKTLLHMAEMYLEWNKYDEAYDFSKQAYDGDNSLERAKEIMDKVGARIFR